MSEKKSKTNHGQQWSWNETTCPANVVKYLYTFLDLRDHLRLQNVTTWMRQRGNETTSWSTTLTLSMRHERVKEATLFQPPRHVQLQRTRQLTLNSKSREETEIVAESVLDMISKAMPNLVGLTLQHYDVGFLFFTDVKFSSLRHLVLDICMCAFGFAGLLSARVGFPNLEQMEWICPVTYSDRPETPVLILDQLDVSTPTLQRLVLTDVFGPQPVQLNRPYPKSLSVLEFRRCAFPPVQDLLFKPPSSVREIIISDPPIHYSFAKWLGQLLIKSSLVHIEILRLVRTKAAKAPHVGFEFDGLIELSQWLEGDYAKRIPSYFPRLHTLDLTGVRASRSSRDILRRCFSFCATVLFSSGY